MNKIPILSILIASLRARHHLYNRLVGQLKEQQKASQTSDTVQILSMIDNGETPVGVKRNALMMAAQGKYVAYIDDDDRISTDYLSCIINAITENPNCDCVELYGNISIDGDTPKKFHHSLIHTKWYKDDNGFYRTPGHLNAIKKSIAEQFKFPSLAHGEDHEWSNQIYASKLLKNEAKLDKIIYFYDFKFVKIIKENK